ncbi:dTDP-4-dehydrorhamnose reductase [Marinobacter sp. LM1]|uniref:dTDP-4-dehydrorhamnose reductase n=1 Tax=Marinobacter sp. LM1 TaxID=3003349 RepID=UPI001A124D13|nr:dTDP-4-dehydrorhamnose reductase [Alphaproteobacteria bacterium]|tara:strand:+ start:578 stop:1462 length:885 start_codon:yes stop_codon:yes gene_type:complete
MRVLITGACGQLGKCLQDSFKESSHEVIAASRSELDITSSDSVESFVLAHEPDVIINAAAYTSVDKAEVESDLAFKVNADAVANLAAAVNKIGAFLIHVSTDYVFDGSLTRPYREGDSVNPMGVYGKSKLAGEREAEKANRYVIVRAAWIFSEYGSNFLKTMVRLGSERDSLSIVNDQIGAPTYAGDLAEALRALAESPPVSGTYHFSGGQRCSWYGFAQEIFQTCGVLKADFQFPVINPIPTSEFPTPAKRPAFSVLDGGLLEARVGIREGSWADALRDVCSKVLEADYAAKK